MKLKEIEKLSEQYLQKCVELYGYSKFFECEPYLEFYKSIYARYSGEDDAEGEQSPDAEFDSVDNSLIIYYPNIKSKKHLAETIIHEYTHYLQSPTWMERYYKMGYTYDNHPYELAATKAEKDWKKVA